MNERDCVSAYCEYFIYWRLYFGRCLCTFKLVIEINSIVNKFLLNMLVNTYIRLARTKMISNKYILNRKRNL